MFEHLFNRLPGLIEEPWFPQAATLDLEENEKEYRVRVDLPGFEPGEIAVEVTDRCLLIRARHETTSENRVPPRTTGAEMMGEEMVLARQVELPSCVEVGKVTASYHLGQLEIMLPRKECVLPRKVAVTT